MNTKKETIENEAGDKKKYTLRCFTIRDKCFNQLMGNNGDKKSPRKSVEVDGSIEPLLTFKIPEKVEFSKERFLKSVHKDCVMIRAPGSTGDMLFVSKKDKDKVVKIAGKEFEKQIVDGLHPIIFPLFWEA